MARVLIVEDEGMLLDMMCTYMRGAGHEVSGSKSYDEALSLAYEKSFDLCIFTTSLNTLQDVESGFRSGCDDYLKKPFELKELALRADNLLKRTFVHNAALRENIGGGFSFDMAQHALYRDGRAVPMPQKQARLLALLLKNRDKLLSKDEIFAALWDYDESPSELSLRVYIAELRKILGKDRIINASKLGYKYL